MTSRMKALWGALLLLPVLTVGPALAAPVLDPLTLTKYMDPLPIPGPSRHIGIRARRPSAVRPAAGGS